ncbi:arginyl-tRNA synthetase [Niastella koreensis GR20-10]|uniref:Arginine--tRNA ligase n=2 Tax=Niastella koreensis TaxID=354356 RepID=G8TGL9_NIAKG|nr:arginyl-tRNA synthetase [Niastella koreensis GR20-10]
MVHSGKFAVQINRMAIVPVIQQAVSEQLNKLYQVEVNPASITVSETKPEFEGDYTVVLFALLKTLKKKPEELGNELGQALVTDNGALFSAFNVIKGFLNLAISDSFWLNFLKENYKTTGYGRQYRNGKRVMVEYSSPNTNKPLHLGHLRNNFLGWSVAEIYKANGYQVIKTCIANDRGIHICKSMIAWQLFGNGATPESTGIKGDHLVGDYYVLFGTELKKQMAPIREKKLAELLAAGKTREQAEKILEDTKQELEKEAPIMQAAQQMLVDWEAGKPDVVELWRTMNSWVYKGFEETYRRIGSDFDKIYYESETYLLGKDLVEEGLQKKVFFLKEDGSAWVDLTADGLDQKIVRRRDGTAVYITQDIGLAEVKQNEFNCDLSVYVVGDEQNYHFKVLKLICQKLGIAGADGIFHLSYGMVELPTGRMKTREGTVVDADDILDEMNREATRKRIEREEEQKAKGQHKTEEMSAEELKQLDEMVGAGGLKFFLLRVDPQKRMIFNPEESIELNGFTATFVQYAYARTQSVFRKELYTGGDIGTDLLPLEKELILSLERYPEVLKQACAEMSPSVVAGYVFNVAQLFNTFYNKHSFLNAETPVKKELRLQINQMVANVLKTGMALLGIEVPERM